MRIADRPWGKQKSGFYVYYCNILTSKARGRERGSALRPCRHENRKRLSVLLWLPTYQNHFDNHLIVFLWHLFMPRILLMLYRLF